MLFVNQFEIMLKDFLPHRSDGIIITDRNRGTTTTVSNRLYAKLTAYADDNRLPLDSVVDQKRFAAPQRSHNQGQCCSKWIKPTLPRC
jgi:hypothetical protein